MTARRSSVALSGRSLTLLIILGCPSVVCLVNEKVTVQPATTTGYHSTATMTPNVTGKPSLSFVCGNNSHHCMDYCGICEKYFHAPSMDCLSALFHHLCLDNFNAPMLSLNSTDWCVWSKVNGLYSNLSICTETISDCLRIPWPNPLVEQTFVNVHSTFFRDCPSEELTDPPPLIVFALVITPICLIPVMVSLVVFKTKNGDGSS